MAVERLRRRAPIRRLAPRCTGEESQHPWRVREKGGFMHIAYLGRWKGASTRAARSMKQMCPTVLHFSPSAFELLDECSTGSRGLNWSTVAARLASQVNSRRTRVRLKAFPAIFPSFARARPRARSRPRACTRVVKRYRSSQRCTSSSHRSLTRRSWRPDWLLMPECVPPI